AKPGEEKFTYQAQRDGYYWFTVRTLDNQNRFNPPQLDQQTPPALRVCVITSRPAVVLQPLPARDGLVGVEWEIRHSFPVDLDTLRLDYRLPGGNQWLPLYNAERATTGKYSWNTATGPAEVRLQVQDRAGNPGEKSVVLGDQRGDPGTATNVGSSGIRRV